MNSKIMSLRIALLSFSIQAAVGIYFPAAGVAQQEVHAFTSDAGNEPHGRLVQATDGNFYGTTEQGGTNGGFGTVFKMTPGGSLSVLVHFSGRNGRYPMGGLIQASDGNFYGTTHSGGATYDNGTVFKMTPAGQLTTLVSFGLVQLGRNIAAGPVGELVEGIDGNFYGATRDGGPNFVGNLYKITPTGTVTALAYFDGENGSQPRAGLVRGSDGNFYGTTDQGGTNGNFGTVFKMTPTGVLTSLFSFSGTNGSHPRGSLVQGSDGSFYGTTREGGPFDDGNVFKITPSGTLTVMASFQGNLNGRNSEAGLVQGNDGNFFGTTWGDDVFKITPGGVLTKITDLGDANGGNPLSSLIQGNDGFLYGTTSNEGANGFGTVFKVSTAGALTTLVSFGASSGGATPKAGLVTGSDGYFYGTTSEGGSGSSGTVFKTSPSGDFTTIYSFSLRYPNSGAFGDTNSDGATPQADLIRGSDGNFYGTTSEGGGSGVGTAFKISTNGVMTTLYSFGPLGPLIPKAGLVEGTDGNFYGTTYGGGIFGVGLSGTVFKMTPAGEIITLAAFAITNGAVPQAALVQGTNGDFYGTTYIGGPTGVTGGGTIFKITPSGSLTMLVSFTGINGANPAAGLVQGSDGNFYGTTVNGGASGIGTVFKMTPAGELTTLVSFAITNGAGPYAGLIQGGDGNFYGTTSYGGLGGGTAFQMTPSGTLTVLGRFTATGDNGFAPLARVVEGIDGNFYGTTSIFGSGGKGNIFRVGLAVAPSIASHPQSQGILAGLAANFSVSASGNNLSYQWRRNGANLSNKTNSSLTISNVQVADQGAYSVRVSNSFGSATSSNAVLTVVVPDATKPTIVITSPAINQRLSNSVATFQGTAKDNFALDHVAYQLNGGPAQTATGTSNWSTTVNLIAGTSTFSVKSVDTNGNESLVASRSVFFVVPSPLTLTTNGRGSIVGATNGQRLEVGRGYKLTAAPSPRNFFVNWSGGLSSTNPVFTFLMPSNLTLQANFVTNPFVGLKGKFHGLFSETNEVRNHDRSGAFTLTLAEAGTYSASFQLGPKKLSATGKFDLQGQSLLKLKPSNSSTVTVALQLDLTNLNARVDGVVSNEVWTSPLHGYRAPLYPAGSSSPQAGKYTLVIPGNDDPAMSPGGDGYGTVTISPAGALKLAGKLADGTVLSQSIPVSADGWWALYSSLYTGKGSVQGWMTFTNEDDADITGTLSWSKPALTASKYYPLGFTNKHDTVGSIYVAPTTNRVVNIATGLVEFRHGNLLQPITNNVFLTTNNKIANLSSNKLTMTFKLPSGLFTGSVTPTNTGKAIKFSGVLLQKLDRGYGHFLGTNQSGQTILAPAP